MTSIESPLESQVRHDPDDTLDGLEDETTIEDAPLEDEGGQTTIIDRSAYEREDLQIPKVDGETIDQIVIKGQVLIRLSRSEPSDVAVFNQLKLGREVQLLVDAKCIGTGATGATNKDGDLDVIMGVKTLKVHSISKPAGADWVQDTA